MFLDIHLTNLTDQKPVGSGKTILCANVIQYLFGSRLAGDQVSYFLVHHSKPESLKAETILRSIIWQSLDLSDLRDDIESLLRDFQSKKLYVSLEDWNGLLQKRVLYSKRFYIVVDGLDECDVLERQALLKSFSSLAASAPGLKIFVAGRDSLNSDFLREFPTMIRIDMKSEGQTVDINAYIETSLEARVRSEQLICVDPQLVTEIKTSLTQHADGMFLWIAFLLDEICTGTQDDEIRQCLSMLPRGLEETFERALQRVLRQGKYISPLVAKIFRWVVAATEPLTLEQLSAAVSVEIGQTSLNPTMRDQDLSSLVLWSQNLLSVTEVDSLVQFPHETIFDFLTQTKLPSELHDFHMNKKECDHFLGEICVTYLHLGNFQSTVSRRAVHTNLPPGIVDHVLHRVQATSPTAKLATKLAGRGQEIRQGSIPVDLGTVSIVTQNDTLLRQVFPLLKYASIKWLSHTSNFKSGKSRTWTLWHRMITSGHPLAVIPWPDLKSLQAEPWSYVLVGPNRLLHCALISYLVEDGTISSLRSLLRHAPCRIDEETFLILLWGLESVLNIGEEYRCGQIAELAIEYDYPRVIDGLIKARYDINNRVIESGIVPLRFAIRHQRTNIATQLIRAGADVLGHAGPDATTALHEAIRGMKKSDILSILPQFIHHGADINAVDTYGRTALHFAVSNTDAGDLSLVIEQLIKSGANVNARKENGWTPLHTATYYNQTQVIELLLSSGADIEARDDGSEPGRTPLDLAVENDSPNAIRTLLKAGARVDSKTIAVAAKDHTSYRAQVRQVLRDFGFAIPE